MPAKRRPKRKYAREHPKYPAAVLDLLGRLSELYVDIERLTIPETRKLADAMERIQAYEHIDRDAWDIPDIGMTCLTFTDVFDRIRCWIDCEAVPWESDNEIMKRWEAALEERDGEAS